MKIGYQLIITYWEIYDFPPRGVEPEMLPTPVIILIGTVNSNKLGQEPQPVDFPIYLLAAAEVLIFLQTNSLILMVTLQHPGIILQINIVEI